MSDEQFERRAGRRIDLHMIGGCLKARQAQGDPGTFLGFGHIGDQRAERGAGGAGKGRGIDGVLKGFAQQAGGCFGLEALMRAAGGSGQPVRPEDALFGQLIGEAVRQDHLGGVDAGDFIGQGVSIEVGDQKLAGGNVGPGHCVALTIRAEPGEGQKEVVAPGGEQVVLGQRAGGDEPHHVAFDHGFAAALFGFGGVFDLFANGDLVAQ